MKRQSIQKAYRNIQPNEEARERMLHNILLSSEIPPTGKDERRMRRKMKPIAIAALIALIIMLVGCAIVYVMYLEDLKIGEFSYTVSYWDEEGYRAEKEIQKDYYSIHGFENSSVNLAQQEWKQFREAYDPDLEIHKSVGANEFEASEEYDAYLVYSQEMVDKVDEIAEKYGLNLLGACAIFQQWESDVFYKALEIESLLAQDAKATIKTGSGHFYEKGNFYVSFYMNMPEEQGQWPYEMLNSIYYSKKDNFDSVGFSLDVTEDLEQWYYVTASGAEVLIVNADDRARVFYDREDAMIYLKISNHYDSDFDYDQGEYQKITYMTKEQLETVIDQFNFDILVENVNMDLAREKLECFGNP